MKKIKTGLFFGSFNPIHVGHLILANHITEYTDLLEVWLVISPQNPFKDKKSLLNEKQRLNMVELALEDYPKLKASNIEFSLPKPSYTVDTLAYLQEKYLDREFVLIMGEDNIKSFHKWKNYSYIAENYEILVYPRMSEENTVSEIAYKKIEAPIIQISSTQIRNMIKEGKNYRPLLPEKVFDYIDGSSLYKK